MGLHIFANHAHVFPESLKPDGTITRLLQLLDACDIERAVAFAPLAHQCDGTNIEPNRWVASELKNQPRLSGFGTIDLRRTDVREQVKHARELGLLGLKLHPNAQKFDILSPRAMELYQAAEEHSLFISFHTGIHRSRLGQSRVINFDEIAWNFPRLKFSLEHVGGYHFFNEALAVLAVHLPAPWETGTSNVFAGLTSVFTTPFNKFWHMSDEQLRELAGQVGARQLIFGLDFPYNLEEHTRTGLRRVRELFGEQDQSLILGGNLRRELGVP